MPMADRRRARIGLHRRHPGDVLEARAGPRSTAASMTASGPAWESYLTGPDEPGPPVTEMSFPIRCVARRRRGRGRTAPSAVWPYPATTARAASAWR